MSDLPQEPIFFHDQHRAFLENRDVDVLDWKVMRLNLYWLKTGATFPTYRESWRAIIIYLAIVIVVGGVSIGFLIGLGIVGIEHIIQHGIPHWRLIVYCLMVYGWFVALMTYGSLICWASLKAAVIAMCWPDRRITTLLKKVAQDGQLIKGEIMATKSNDHLKWETTYRFTTPAGKEIERGFLPCDYQKYERGRPVWVLYLNDKISVLL